MAIEVQLFDGTVLEFPDGTPQNVVLESARRITAQRQQAAPKEEPGLLSQITGTPKEFVKGLASGLVQAVGGLGALPYAAARYAVPELKPFEETALGRTVTQAEKALAPGDEGYITQLAGGLGSFASIFGPQALLRGIGTAGRLATGIAPKAATPVALGQTTGLGVEEARQRAAVARAEGVETTPGEELAALAIGVPIGLTELLPVERLFKGLDTGLSEGFKYTIANRIKRALQQGGIEGAQEVASGLMQDLSAKGIYNPNLAVGQSMFDELTVGGGVGAIAQTGLDILFKRRIQDAYNTTQRKKAEDEIRKRADEARAAQEKQIATTKEQLGITEPKTLALPAPAEKVEAGEEIDPLQNPLGMFKPEQLEEGYVREVNKMRDQQGMAKVKSLSIEDIADAGAPQGEIDRLIAGRLSEQGVDVDKGLESKLTMADIENIATQKNIDTDTQGFKDFLRRTTGTEGKLSPVQTLAAFESLSKLPAAPELQILPEGTNATRFTQEQYDKTVKSIKDLFPETGKLGRSQVIQEIKDYSGLENDRDAQSLLQAAIRNGDFTTESTRNFLTLDKDGKQVGIAYPDRKTAERAAKARGLSVKERTSIDIALPEVEKPLPGGPDIRRGEFKEGEVPAAYEIKSDQAVLATAKTEEEAAAKAERLQALRENKANGLLGQIKSIDSNIAKSQQKLESMEADGKADTLEYRQLSAKIAANNANLEAQKGRLNAQAQQYLTPVTVSPKGVKPVARAGYTLFEKGKPKATFPTQQAAEEAALVGLETEQLQALVNLAPSQKGLQAKRLGKMARDELARRLGGEAPAGIKVKPTTTVKEAEEKLADLGIFTPKFKQQVDELEKKLRPVLDKLGLKDLRLNIVRAIQTPEGEFDGSYAEKLVTIALNSDNPIRTLRHEAIHALKELGAFTDAQWKVLEKNAKESWLGKYGIDQRYKGLTQSEQIEEAIADAFSDFDQTKPPAGLVGALFNKVKKFFEAMGNAMRGMGFQTAEDVFANVEKGVTLPEGVETAQGTVKYAKRGEKQEEPKITGTGKIIGAPPGKSSEEDRKKLVRDMVKTLETDFSMYERSKDWYERSGSAIRDITRGDPELMERVVRLMALYSQSNAVGGNTTATIDSIYQLATGETAYAGRFPNVTAERIPAILKAKTMDDSLPGVDDKLMNFYRNLHDATFETDTFEDASTIDRWMMRLFGYPHADDQEIGGGSALSKTQYAYAKDIVRRIAEANQKRTGELLKPRQVQAILWTYVKNKTDYDSLPKDKQKDFVPTTIDFTDYITRATANITWESRPSTSLPIIPGIHNAPRKEQEAFNRAVRAILVDPRSGEDKVFKLLGGEQLYSSQFSAGAYDNQIAPNIITKLVLRKADGQYLTTAADKYAAIIGYVTKQDAVPWYRADPKATGKRASKAVRITPSVDIDQDFEESLFKHLNDVMPGIGFTRVDNSFDFVNYRDENGKPNVPDSKYFSDLKKALQSFPQDVTFNEFEFRAESGWISNDWKENPDGQGYLSRFGSGELSDIRSTIDGWSKDYDRIAEEFGREYGWSRPTEPVGRPSTGGGIVLGEKQPGAVSTVGVHYGKEPNLTVLNGNRYGTGIKGAEAARLAQSRDPRVKNRVYFYLTEEGAPLPPAEAGLGNDVYTQKFDNMLSQGDEMQRLYNEANKDLNKFESAVVDAGYDGYAVPSMGMMVILNNDTPVNYQGKKPEVAPKKIKYSVKVSLKESIDPDTATAIDRTTTTRQNEGYADRIIGSFSAEARARFRAGIINRYEGIERLTKAKAEEFGDQELLADQSAIAAALFSDRAAGVAASSFRNGVPVYEKGYTNVSDLGGTVKGLIPIFEPLMKYNDPYIFQMFQFYAATKRGKRLDAEGREKLFTQEDIKRGQALKAQYPEFKQAFDDYQRYNQGLVKFMKDTGVISDKEAQVWTQNWDYIPFYRQMDGEVTAGPRVFSAISGVAKPKKLKGGEAPLADFMETIVRNSRAAIEAGMKNVASQRVVRDVVSLGLGEEVSAKEAVGTDIVTVKENGLTKYYRVADPLLVESMKGLNLPQLPFLDILSKPAEFLRNMVTKDPGFILANLLRDSVQAWVTTGQKMTPVIDTFKQYGAALANMSPESRALAQAGLFTGYDFSGDVKATSKEVEAELRRRSGNLKPVEIAKWPLTKIWNALEKASTASDVATRAEVYKRVLKETGNEAEAMYQAMEVLNFSRRGNSALIRVLTAVVPFMNARIQGLDVLYRAGFGEMATKNREIQQKAFITRSLTIMGLSAMYWALASDSEEYKTAEPEQRDNYWIIGSVRIPIPFEIGTVFKVFPERILEYWFGQDTGKDLKNSIVRNITDTLKFNPIPQAVLPFIENIANYSFFTGQPIVGKGMEDVAPKFQATTGTSLLAKEVGEFINQSPIKIDNLIRGYTGTLGTYAVLAIDSIMRDEGDPTKAAMKAEQLPVIKRFYASEKGTGTITAYYDLKQQVEEATRTINYLTRTGNSEDLKSYLEDKGAKLLAIKPFVQSMDKNMTQLREMRQAVLVSKIDPDRKREILDNIRQAEVNLTARIQLVKKQIS